MSTLNDIETTKPTKSEVVNKDITLVYNSISRNAKFCFANNSATNYTVDNNLTGNTGEIIIMTGAELVSADIWFVARLKKQDNKTVISYTIGSKPWESLIKKFSNWAVGKNGC